MKIPFKDLQDKDKNLDQQTQEDINNSTSNENEFSLLFF